MASYGHRRASRVGVDDMDLYELAYAVRLYGQLTSFDRSIERLRAATVGVLDLTDAGQASACLTWLRAWGCRQFSVEHTDEAIAMLADWSRCWSDRLPSLDTEIDTLADGELETAASAFGDLAQREAGRRALRDGRTSSVTVGPTGASKVLHIVRPQALPPWDDPIRKALGFDSGSGGYLRYLRDVRTVVLSLHKQAANAGIDPADLSAAVGRPDSALPKLVDEYNWITITRGITPPSADDLRTWYRWAVPER